MGKKSKTLDEVARETMSDEEYSRLQKDLAQDRLFDEMLAALKDILVHIEWRKSIAGNYDTTGRKFREIIEALIAKAEGNAK